MELQIYNHEKRYESTLKNLKDKNVLQKNKDLILKFERYLKVNLELSLTRRIKYIQILANCAELLGKDFEQANKEDIEKLVEKIDDNSKWKETTKRAYKVFIKRFYKWLITNDEEYPPMVKWIKTTDKYEFEVKKSELLTQEELELILSVCRNARDKAFIHVLYESGCRIGEIGTLRLKDIHFDKYGCQLNVKGKTGKRPIRLVKSVSDLNYWDKHHLNKDKNPEDPLWCVFGEPKQCLTYSSYRKILIRAFKTAGIKKKCNPHILRHGAITRLAGFLSDQELKVYAGWRKNSNMMEIYSHITGGEVANKILKIHGIKKEDETIETKPFVCPNCNAPNSGDAQFCYHCRHILDEKLAQKGKEEIDVQAILSNPKVMERLVKGIMEKVKDNEGSI